MAAVIGIVIVLFLWRFLVVFGTTVFETAGLSPSAAGFESRSALVGAGYTTAQSELVTADPMAQRVASLLIVTGYLGPTTLLALLGISFAVPTDDDLTDRAVVLIVLLAAFLALDRFGILRGLAAGPARALARRRTGAGALETWIVVGDRAVAAVTVSADPEVAAASADRLASDALQVLAVERARSATVSYPDDQPLGSVAPGDRVVVFGPRPEVEALRSMTANRRP